MATKYFVLGRDEKGWFHEITLDSKSDADTEIYSLKNRTLRTKVVKKTFQGPYNELEEIQKMLKEFEPK